MQMSYLHVKWFSDHEQETMRSLSDVIGNASFLFWFAVTMIGLLLSAMFNEKLQHIPLIERIHRMLDRARPYLTHILRIGLGLGIVMQLVSSTYIAPEWHTEHIWIAVVQCIVLAGLMTRFTLWISGTALAVLYGSTVIEFGVVHALDYSFYIGIIYYLFVSTTRWKSTATPVLYLFTGFSLAWVALEKFTLPGLAYGIIEQHHIPTFGFSPEDFVLISAFIEIGLAWSFIVGILNRFVSIVVTLVFITTTTVFGMTEVVGHTILHTLLILFVIEGEGTFKTPFRFHQSPLLRCLFVIVNFCILLFGLMAVYVAVGA